MVLEGGAIAVDGEGTLVTTEQCLLNPNRNPLLNRNEIEAELRLQLGAEQIVWLGRGLVEDADTDGHVDNVCAFLAPRRALLQTAPDADDPNAVVGRGQRAATERGRDRDRALGAAAAHERADGSVVAIPYTNFYLCNGAAIVPLGEQDLDMDAEALRRLGELLPGREIVGVPGRVLALGGGGVHCITQQVPSGTGDRRLAASSLARLPGQATLTASWPGDATARLTRISWDRVQPCRARARAGRAGSRARRGRARRARRPRRPPGALRAVERAAAGGGDVDEVTAAVERVASALGVLGRLELVQEQHEVVGVDAQRLAERLLRGPVVVVEERQRDVPAQAHAEAVLVAATVDDLRESREEDHRSRCMDSAHRTEIVAVLVDRHKSADDLCYSDDR